MMEYNWTRPEQTLPGDSEMVVIKTYNNAESYFLAVYVGYRTAEVAKSVVNKLKKVAKGFYDYDDVANKYYVPEGFYGYNPNGNPYKLKFNVEFWHGLSSMPREDDE